MMKLQLVLDQRCGLGFCSEVRYNNLQKERNVTIASRETNNLGMVVTTKLLQELQSCGISNTNLQVNQTVLRPKLSIGLNKALSNNSIVEGYVSIDQLQDLIESFANDPGFVVKLEVYVDSITVHGTSRTSNFTVLKLTPDPKCYYFNLTRGETGQNQLKPFKATIERQRGEDCFGNFWYSSRDPSDSFYVDLSLALMIHSVDGPDPDVADHLVFTRKMLTDKSLADVTIIAGNQVEIKCHRSVLAAHSPVFAAMFQPENGMTEAQTGILKREDLCEESVRAFLEYMYVWKSRPAEENSSVCVDLLKLSDEYDIKPLQKCMEKILLRKTEDWFTGDSLVRLILYLNLNRGLKELKTRARELFESKYGEVKKLEVFEKLRCEYTEDVKKVMELFSTAAVAD